MQQQPADLSALWTQHQRRINKTTLTWACEFCPDRRIFMNADDLWNHALESHRDRLPKQAEELEAFRGEYESNSFQKRNERPNDDPQSGKAISHETTAKASPPPLAQTKRPLYHPTEKASTQSISELRHLQLKGTQKDVDTPMTDNPDTVDQPRKRAAIGEGIGSTGSASPAPVRDSESPPPRRSKARPTSAPYGSTESIEVKGQGTYEDIQRPRAEKRQLWTPDQDSPMPRASLDQSKIASTHTIKKNQVMPPKARKPLQAAPQPGGGGGVGRQAAQSSPNPNPSVIFGRPSTQDSLQTQPKDESFDIVMQPETRPISQEQLVAEVKGIYAGLVMVEAKCIEVDNKQATLASADPGAQPKLNNEQWQALIALHRTLLHEHHDFFLASQHPSASPALRRLASKYAMPARMWRHGIHSFLELLRHRLPASLDHMLAFIYLAYSMMALLYETVPAFEDTWIECLGDLGRYRMAIEDDDIRDREVWTGVARHWYSKASDKAPTTGRLYHHLAILARPNALQQLFYYSKSLCVAVPFTSARESILTLFDPVLNSENGQGQYRLPPLDTAFVRAHGLLFTNKDLGTRYEASSAEFLALLDNQIGRVTRKFMEQGYHIAVANSVQLLGFASADNPLMKAISPPSKDEVDVHMGGTLTDIDSPSLAFKKALQLNHSTLSIVLRRIGDPNVLPFIHTTLVFMYRMSRHTGAMNILRADFPWELLSIMLNTLLVSCESTATIESDMFPSPEKDDARPLPEDFALRGLLWAEDLFPTEWFDNEKIDEDEKYHERASMTAQRKERALWLAVRIAKNPNSGLKYDSGIDGKTKAAFSARAQPITIVSRASTMGSIASRSTSNSGSIDRQGTWASADRNDNDYQSEVDDDNVAVRTSDPSSYV